MKPIILAVVGMSGSGKTTLAEYLRRNYRFNTIVSYTTRPIRENETDGIEHWFVSDNDMPEPKDMLAYTQFDKYHYWANHSQVSKNNINVYVIDEKGLENLIDLFDDIYDIRTVFVHRNEDVLSASIDKERLDRDKDRHILEPDYYDLVINNNGSLGDFYDIIDSTLINGLLNYGSTKR